MMLEIIGGALALILLPLGFWKLLEILWWSYKKIRKIKKKLLRRKISTEELIERINQQKFKRKRK